MTGRCMVPVYGRRREPIESRRTFRRCAFRHAESPARPSGPGGITVTPPGDDHRVTTQLRLVDTPEAPPAPASRARQRRRAPAPVGARPSGRTHVGAARAGGHRRAVRWGDWQLDARTRTVGRRASPPPARRSSGSPPSRSGPAPGATRARSAWRAEAPGPLPASPTRREGRTLCRMGDTQRPTPSDWQELAAKELKGDPASLDLEHPRGHPGQAALHRGRPRGPRGRRHAARASTRSSAACGPRCTPTGRGRSASTPASPPPRSRTPSTGRTSPPGRWACRSPSTSPPTAATTATTRASSATSARPAWRSTPSRT